jgi:large repetitive protein
VFDDEAYTYDHVGNRQTALNATGSITHNDNNELLLYGDIEYTYDANGNMTQKKVGTTVVNYLYNAENRLVQVADDLTKTVIAEYGYDLFGRRLWKEVQGVRTYFFYSEEGLIAEYDAKRAVLLVSERPFGHAAEIGGAEWRGSVECQL